MKIKFKINYKSTKNEWVGWFGEDVMKLRLASSQENLRKDFIDFLNSDLGILESDVEVLNINPQKGMIEVKLPDVAWELLLGAIEK